MPLFQIAVLKDGAPVADEAVRAVTAEQARTHLRLRLARCKPGETLVLTLNGVEQGRIGPRRV